MTRRIAILTHFYPPELCAASNRAESLAKALVRAGNAVTVVTNFPSFPEAKLRPEDRFHLRRDEKSSGCDVIRLLTATFKGLPKARLFQWLFSAATATTFLLLSRRRFDTIVVTTPPITLAVPALIGAWRHRAKLVVDVRDVFPDIAIAMGEWPADGIFARATEWLARRLYRRADLVSAVTQTAIRQIESRDIAASKMLLAPNGCDFWVSREAKRTRADDVFVALYAGNLGLASNVDVLLDAAAMLREKERIAIWIAGDGVEGERLRKRVVNEGLENVRLWGSVAREEAMQMMADADVSLVPLRKGIGESIPTKIFDALSVGCPVLVAAEGEAREAALASGGGIAVPPGDPRALADAIAQLATVEKQELRARGTRGKSFVFEFYERDRIMLQYSARIGAL